jgi:hypothetical protein
MSAPTDDGAPTNIVFVATVITTSPPGESDIAAKDTAMLQMSHAHGRRGHKHAQAAHEAAHGNYMPPHMREDTPPHSPRETPQETHSPRETPHSGTTIPSDAENGSAAGVGVQRDNLTKSSLTKLYFEKVPVNRLRARVLLRAWIAADTMIRALMFITAPPHRRTDVTPARACSCSTTPRSSKHRTSRHSKAH